MWNFDPEPAAKPVPARAAPAVKATVAKATAIAPAASKPAEAPEAVAEEKDSAEVTCPPCAADGKGTVRKISVPKDMVHVGVHCNICKAKPIVGPRFKCLNCADFDMCFKCATSSSAHPPKHIMMEVRKCTPALRAIKPRPCVAVDVQQAKRGFHPGVQCAECRQSPVAGPRYKCVVCDKYDLCKDCANSRREALAEGKPVRHHAGHAFMRVRMPWVRSQCTMWQYTPEVIRKAITHECWEITQEERKASGLPAQSSQSYAAYDPRPNPARGKAGKKKGVPAGGSAKTRGPKGTRYR